VSTFLPASLGRISNLGVLTKILAAVAVAAMVAAIVGIIGLLALSRTAHAGAGMYQSTASIEADAKINAAVEENRIAIDEPDVSKDDLANHAQDAAIAQADSDFKSAIAAYSASKPVAPTSLIDRVQAEFANYSNLFETRGAAVQKAHNLVALDHINDTVLSPVDDAISSDLAKINSLEDAAAIPRAKTIEASYRSARTQLSIILVVGLAVAMTLGTVVARSIVASLGKVRAATEALALGDLTKPTGLSSTDEVGELGRALDTALSSLRDLVSNIDTSASSLSAASSQLAVTSDEIADSAQQTSVQADAVAAAASEVSTNVKTVAAGSSEIEQSIAEIARSTSEAASAGSIAVTVASATNDTVTRLGKSSTEIEAVVKAITAIAQQTNLLALNATIEAARAGDAGKGFAVVAGEVKDLASETAKATSDIFSQVQAIQGDTAAAVEAIAQISDVITQINDFQVTISSAIEEQTATTNEMNRNVSQAALGSEDIAANIGGVAAAAQRTTAGAVQSQAAILQLAEMSVALKTLVSRFTV
jgi:methyl-accepting chemotaxis protein